MCLLPAAIRIWMTEQYVRGDAFIAKPCFTAILLAKITSLLKRAYPDIQSRHLTYQGVSLSLD